MKKLLVATDFSSRSDRALRRAVLLARAHDAHLTLAHVVDDDQPAYLVDREIDLARRLLEDAARTLSDVDGLSSDVTVAGGDAFAGILAVADDVDPDLIVMGPHRRQFLDTFVGTTAERTIRRSARPILMANTFPSGAYDRTLLAVDLDEASRAAVQTATRFGILEHTEITLLHLFDAPAVGMMKRAMELPEAIGHYLRGAEKRARDELTGFLGPELLAHARSVLEPLQGSTAAQIRTYADEQSVDMIVLGTNQRKGLPRLFLGSVALEVLWEAKQDVLVIPLENHGDADIP